MKTDRRFNPSDGLEAMGLGHSDRVRWNAAAPDLYETAVRRSEGLVAEGGAFAVVTAPHTGRSPADKFIVLDPTTQVTVWWENNKPMSPENFCRLKQDFIAEVRGREVFVQDLYGGADPAYRLPVRVICEYAWHGLFIRHLMIRPPAQDYQGFSPKLTIVDLPSFRADPERHGVRSPAVIACDMTNGMILIGGTSYAGEMKKSVFTVLNYLLPQHGVMPMHCSANIGRRGDTALFFGLSGTGKTTLSADPNRTLIGDDEHGWSKNGIFNFEGGCYAKVIRLSAEAEPQIFAATRRWATVLENVVVDPVSRKLNLDDSSLTENTRAAYPLDYIPNASTTGLGDHPTNIIMLTADAFGVMPPIARLTPSQAMYHFLSGYTAKVAGTEDGVKEPEATFSACFGQPFMPRHPIVYGNLLRDLISRHRVKCWMVNTGWTGGAYGVGHRMPIKATRALLAQALEGKFEQAAMRIDPWFGFEVPAAAEGIDPQMLSPRDNWADKQAYDDQARRLVQLFMQNFAPLEAHVDAQVKASAPTLRSAAE
ncbi:MAG TPA: phosphoenolpyruvate carboxykinase [Aestuariivirgaceae bacterium]|nr:phosphoenolpyruvate carboxykinase [Aestuariivirgaceae bacterium]